VRLVFEKKFVPTLSQKRRKRSFTQTLNKFFKIWANQAVKSLSVEIERENGKNMYTKHIKEIARYF
jgi:hypothetical protein